MLRFFTSATVAMLLLPVSGAAADASCVCHSGEPSASIDPSLMGEATPLEEESLMWCEGPDDPRCAPTRDDRENLQPFSTSPPSAPTRADALAAPRARDVRFDPPAQPSARGVRSRVDRPPQG